MKELTSIEEKILDSALYMIGSYGSTNVPVRAIVKEAGVNVSAINYYFGSKDNMINHTKEFFIENTKAIYSILDRQELDEKQRLVLFANEIMEYTIRYTGLSAIFKDAERLQEEDDLSKRIVNVTNELHSKMEKCLNNVVQADSKYSEYNLMIFMSSIIHPTEKKDALFYGCDITSDKEKRIEYINYVIGLLHN